MSGDEERIRVAMAMLGSREHYQLARMLYKHGYLESLITDIWMKYPLERLPFYPWLPRPVRRLAGRRSPELPDGIVSSPRLFWLRSVISRGFVSGRQELSRHFLREGQAFAARCARLLPTDADIFFGYTSASLEAIQHAKRHGMAAILGQIDPGPVEDAIVAEESRRFPGWDPSGDRISPEYFERVREEWNEADVVIVNSTWSRDALIHERVDADKIRILDLGFDGCITATRGQVNAREVRVLWLGTLSLRKGFPYALEAARSLVGKPVRFTFAGPLQVNSSAFSFPANCDYVGQVPRNEAAKLYASHDIFILPTLSDGFALTQVEALAYGLPLIVTPCCGDVAEHGRCGFIIPPRDSNALRDAILRFVDDRDLLNGMREAAVERAGSFLPNALWPRYRQVLNEVNALRK